MMETRATMFSLSSNVLYLSKFRFMSIPHFIHCDKMDYVAQLSNVVAVSVFV